MKNYNNQKGNVLFLILIAVALFAALSYAVTQSSRSGGDAGRETNILNSAQITQYPNQIRTAILRQIIDGTDITAIRFNSPADFATLDNPRFGVFNPNGGGAVFQDAAGEIMADGNPGVWSYNIEFEIAEIGLSTPSQRGGNEVIAFLAGISEAVCQRINAEAGIRADTTLAPPVASGDIDAVYDLNMVDVGGTDYALPTSETVLDAAALDAGIFDGQPFGCFQNGGAPAEFVYYHVLSER